ncbi:aminoacyl-tRNA hydrolase [Bacteroidales bacterium OttesenSCG-928-K03]|nr:aminoacyl-tRNA hydrolase [Bacteroidales bacterium OttesenSCG-928-L14]MDL2241237.1 aminoacyl-tRNA hydrolase [Bacteroidales bacterium OttesenSCG-928-K22]MDL2242133.1 aminoacyl-tRNA hydrolase [Bacteroidales bacterium OttesenSCG-928-K03]
MNKYLIVGLGNPGVEYENTRHNIGWIILDALCQNIETPFKSERYALTNTVRHKGRILKLIKPTTYMNLSGKAVRYWLEKENIPIENMLVISDDIDLDLGVLRIKTKGSGGTHNGLNNIIEVMGTQNFSRLRFGIGHDYPQGYQVEYVLGKFTTEEREFLKEKINFAVEAVKSFVTAGASYTMTHFNNK